MKRVIFVWPKTVLLPPIAIYYRHQCTIIIAIAKMLRLKHADLAIEQLSVVNQHCNNILDDSYDAYSVDIITLLVVVKSLIQSHECLMFLDCMVN